MTNTALTPSVFSFNDISVRAFADDRGEPWFCAKDVCTVLGYRNDTDAVKKHCREKGVAKRDSPTSGGVQSLAFVNEGNLYRLIIKSRKPEAEKFEQLVMDEILPTIRKTGSYQARPVAKALPDQSKTERDAIRALVSLRLEQVPQARRAEALRACEAAVKFSTDNTLNDIQPERFADAVRLLASLPIKGEKPDLADIHFPVSCWIANNPWLGAHQTGPAGKPPTDVAITANLMLCADYRSPTRELLDALRNFGFDVSACGHELSMLRLSVGQFYEALLTVQRMASLAAGAQFKFGLN